MLEPYLRQSLEPIHRVVELDSPMRGPLVEIAKSIYILHSKSVGREKQTTVAFSYQTPLGTYDMNVVFFHAVLHKPVVRFAQTESLTHPDKRSQDTTPEQQQETHDVLLSFEVAFQALHSYKATEEKAQLMVEPGLLERAAMFLRQIRQ